MCILLQKYDQIKMVQDEKLGLNELKLGDFLVTMRGILRPNNPEYSVVEYYLTKAQIIETQKEVISVLNSVLQNIINDTEITWGLDDAVDIFMTTGSGVIAGNYQNFTVSIIFAHKELKLIKKIKTF